MKKDINPTKITDIFVAIIPEINEEGFTEWNVYLINNKKKLIEGVLVTSQGYGEIKGEHRKTATFRHSLKNMEPKSFKKIETIVEDLFVLSNEFWVSFFFQNEIQDKKFIFLAESIREENFSEIPVIGGRGVLI